MEPYAPIRLCMPFRLDYMHRVRHVDGDSAQGSARLSCAWWCGRAPRTLIDADVVQPTAAEPRPLASAFRRSALPRSLVLLTCEFIVSARRSYLTRSRVFDISLARHIDRPAFDYIYRQL